MWINTCVYACICVCLSINLWAAAQCAWQNDVYFIYTHAHAHAHTHAIHVLCILIERRIPKRCCHSIVQMNSLIITRLLIMCRGSFKSSRYEPWAHVQFFSFQNFRKQNEKKLRKTLLLLFFIFYSFNFHKLFFFFS